MSYFLWRSWRPLLCGDLWRFKSYFWWKVKKPYCEEIFEKSSPLIFDEENDVILNRCHVHWVEFLQSINFIIKHISWLQNVIADALSQKYYLLSTIQVKLYMLWYVEKILQKWCLFWKNNRIMQWMLFSTILGTRWLSF